MQILELHVVAGRVAEEVALLVGQRARLFHRATDVQVAAFQALARRHQRAGTDDHLVLDHRAVHDDAAHADQNAVAQGAAMQSDLVPDRHLVTDDQRVAIRVERPGVGDVQHAAVLHAGARTDADAVHVTADHGHWPDRAVLAQFDIANDHGRSVDEDALTELRSMLLVFANRHDRSS